MDPQSPAPATGLHEFELTDANGVPQRYMVTEHPAGEGMEIMFALLSLGAPTVLGLAGAAAESDRILTMIVSALQGRVDGITSDDDYREIARVVAELDLPKVGREIALTLATGKAPDLTRKIVSRTHRAGKPLRDPLQFDQAFKANYLELVTLVWRICRINRFFPVPDTSGL